jgi:hypothetical protein
MLLANKEGIIQVGAVVNLAAAGVAAAVAVFTLPALAGQLVGTKSLKIRTVQLFNNGAGTQTVLIGTGVGGAFAALLPGLVSVNNMPDTYSIEGLDAINEVEAFATITAYPVALPAGTIDIQLTVAVCG